MSSIVYLGHASFLLNAKDFDVVIDPYDHDSVPNLRFPKGIVADKVFCSHGHSDHNAQHLIAIKANSKDVKVVEATVPHDNVGGAKRGMNKIRMFDLDGLKVVHMGDTGCVLSAKELEPFMNCDVLLAPINGFFTIGPNELKQMVEIIKPRIVVPMHYFMKKYQSGYPDGDMISQFEKLFPNIKYLDSAELNLDEYKDYCGALIFTCYRQ